MNTADGVDEAARRGAHRSKLRWHCRRGMRELDEAMLAYLDHHYDAASTDEQAAFEALLEMQDPELYRHVCGKDRDDRFAPLIAKIARTLGGDDTTLADA